MILIDECVRNCDVHSLGILSAGTLTEPARKKTRIIRRGLSIPQAPLDAPHLHRFYGRIRLAVFRCRRHRLKPNAVALRPHNGSQAPRFCYAIRSTQLRQKARARQVLSTLAFFLLCARSRFPPARHSRSSATLFGWARGG